MKRFICLLLVICACGLLCACGKKVISRNNANNTKTVEDVLNEEKDNGNTSLNKDRIGKNIKTDDDFSQEKCDIDLTVMNSNMIYAEVGNMMANPDDYEGKTIKMTGSFSVYETDARNYYACIIDDATACCSQGIEFVLKNERKYPEEYPEIGTTITVTGRFETYLEGKQKYCQLSDARFN